MIADGWSINTTVPVSIGQVYLRGTGQASSYLLLMNQVFAVIDRYSRKILKGAVY